MATSGYRSEKQKMLAGELYCAGDPELQADQRAAEGWLVRYNASLDLPASARHVLLCEQLATVGQGAVIRPPFYCDYGLNQSTCVRPVHEVFARLWIEVARPRSITIPSQHS
jgi:maltose O-acetyltransferase